MRTDNLVERLHAHAALRPDRVALRVLDKDAIVGELTFAALDLRIRELAAHLQQLAGAGERGVILLPSGIDYAVAFYACLYAGVIAVPAYPPDGDADRHAGRLDGILRDATPRLILTEARLRPRVEAALGLAAGAHIVTVDALPRDAATDWHETSPSADAIAFLQYTSGSTSLPKGVCVSHGNLLANETAMQAVVGGTPDDVMVSWLPLYHDMGLMGGLLNPLFTGYTSVLMSPRNFLERPRRWLEAIDRHGGTISGGPDFAYALCADRISDQAIAGLDLSRWRVAFSGSEFIRARTLDRFSDRFAPARFERRSLLACYGLAEATLLVSAGDCGRGVVTRRLEAVALAAGKAIDVEEGTSALSSCGRAAPDHSIRIMRTDGLSEAGEDEIGEIWVAGPSIAQGYWNNQSASAETFVTRDGRRWLRTGDLGCVRDGELMITGRLKDLLIVRGQNIYPTDIEQAVEAEVPSVRAGRVAAFPVEIDGVEGIGIAAEFSRATLARETPAALAEALGTAVRRQTQDHPAVIILLNPQGMPLTTSGKLQRAACASGWMKGALDGTIAFQRGREQPGTEPPSSATEQAVAEIWQDVLGVTAIGRDDDFFVLGGNSIAAAQIAAAISARFNVELELRSLFDAPTPASLAARIDAAQQRRTGSTSSLPPSATSMERALLSPAQERLWFLWSMDPASTAYTVACSIRFEGPIDPALLQESLASIVRRHEALRTTFVAADGRGMAVLHAATDVVVDQEDCRRSSPDDQASWIAERIRAELAKPFDLVRGPLLRAVLFQLADHRHELLLSAHHIIADGWSLNVLLDELAAHYRAGRGGVASAPLPLQYADHAARQRAWLGGAECERQLAYWRDRLGDTHPVLALPLDRPRPATQSHRGDTIDLPIDVNLAGRLRAVAAERRVSMFMLLLAAYQLLLFRYSGQTDLRVGVPVAGRRDADAERLIGCFVNTLVLRAEPVDRMPFAALLDRAREEVIAGLANQDAPFDRLVEALKPARSGAHNPLFQAKLNYMTAPRGFAGIDGLTAATRIIDLAGSHFDLALDVVDGTDGMTASFNYATDLFDADTVGRIARQFVHMLGQIVDDVHRPLLDFAILDANRQLVAQDATALAETDVVSLFRAAWHGRGDAIALRQGQVEINAAALMQWSDRIAGMLVDSDVTGETPVALWIERSPAFVAALLGVLKAGGAYVPLDPKWSIARVRRILKDGQIATLIGAGDTLDAAASLGVLLIDADRQFEPADGPTASVTRTIHPAQTAYVIYTSGSTGAPKGVAVPHRALANYVQALLARVRPAPGANMAMVSTAAADLGHTVLFGALASGATLNLLRPEAAFDAEAFAQDMRSGEVGILKIVPSHLRGLLQAQRSADLLPRDVLIVGGEACDPALLNEVWQLRPQCRIVNHYGPTETTVGATTHEYAADDQGTVVPIGLPLANLRAHVLDHALNAVPAGVAGELYLGGAGLARGYRGAPAQTAERFVPDPFGTPGARLYRTGDRVRCDQAGRLIFLGRSDDQIKLRGFRIEPGEIAYALRSLHGVADGVVVARGLDAVPPRPELVAYCAPAAGESLRPDVLRERLSALVPDHMVPAHIVVLARLPLTANGKIDRAALPQPAEQAAVAHAAPVGEVEQTIAAVWQDVLGRERIGRDDNFFELGGDSILSLQIIARLRKRGIRVTPKQVFGQQTIAALAAVAAAAMPASVRPGSAQAPSPQDAPPQDWPLLPMQHRFFAADAGNRDHYNQALLLVPAQRMDWTVLQRALACVVDHHAALRLRFAEVDGAWRARASDGPQPYDLMWRRSDVAADEVTALAAAAQASLSLVSGPLLRAVAMDLADGSQRLLITIHHLVVDGVSWRVLLEDIASAHNQLCGGATTVTQPPNSLSAAGWAMRLQAHAASEQLAGELPFWLASTGAAALPCDDDYGGIDVAGDSDEVTLAFDTETTARLLNEAPAAYRTQVNDLLLASLARAVRQWSGCEDVTIELEGHGREDIFADADIARTVGWFTSAFPVRLPCAAGDDAALIKGIKETLRAIPHHGLGYGVLRALGSPEQRAALSEAEEPRISFNYLGRLDASLGAAAPFRMAPESPGPMRSASAPLRAWLTITGEVRDGQLRLAFGYGRRRYRRASIVKLARHYDESLRAVVAHCLSGGHGLTPSDASLSGLDQAALDALCRSLDCRNIEDIYPLSPMQQGLLFHAVRDGKDDVYVNQLSVELRGVAPARLRAAWDEISARHAALRTGFMWQTPSGEAQQIVYRRLDMPVTAEDWRGRVFDGPRAGDLDTALAEAARWDREAGFDIAQPPLQRLRLIQLDDDRLWLIWTHHHIVLDGWSSARLLADILRHACGAAVPMTPGSYRDYIGWLAARDRTATAAFWREAVSGLDSPTMLADALRSGRPVAKATGHARLSEVMDRALTQRLRAFARRERITLNTLLQGGWAQLLRQQTSQAAVCFGVTVAGRPADLAGAEQMVGLFINTLPAVDAPHPQTAVGDWLRRLQAQNIAMREHEWLPLHEIQHLAGHAGAALFDSIMVFENYPVDQALAGADGVRIGRVEHVTPTNYALAVAVFDGAGSLRLDFNYDSARLDEQAVQTLSGAWLDWLQRIAAGADGRLGNLAAVGGDDLSRLSRWGRCTDRPAPALSSVVARFEEQAARSPDAVAIISGGRRISHGEVNARANALARRLRAHGIGPERRVGLALPRGGDAIVALLAVLKAGGAYVPLDPGYPPERLSHMLRDSGVALVLTDDPTRDRLAAVWQAAEAEIWCLDARQVAIDNDGGDLGVAIHPDQLAYMIYTSGSTGRPKGVAVAHGPLAMHCDAIGRLYGMSARDRELQTASLNFDIAQERWLVPLLHGGALVLPETRDVAIEDLLREIETHAVNAVFLPPAYADALSEVLRQRGRKLTLRLCIVGGEAWTETGVRALRRTTTIEHLINAYGPTETVIAPTAWPVDDSVLVEGRYAPIGRPVGARAAHVLDDNLNMVPVGAVGELFIGGLGLARGYLDRAALTSERFIPDPFGGAGARLYRTGDLVRWRDNGVLDYVGRADQQLKIRGFRIEPGEIEGRLSEHHGVRSAVVVAHGAGAGRQLVGYVSGEPGLDGKALRSALSTLLPEPMVPSRIIVLERMPLTQNGKVDRQRLPPPDSDGADVRAYSPPAGEIEVAIAAMWSELLGIDRVGRDDHFFELGGHSLLAVRLFGRMSQEFGISLPLSELFAHPELAAFARIVSIALIEAEFDSDELHELMAVGQ